MSQSKNNLLSPISSKSTSLPKVFDASAINARLLYFSKDASTMLLIVSSRLFHLCLLLYNSIQQCLNFFPLSHEQGSFLFVFKLHFLLSHSLFLFILTKNKNYSSIDHIINIGKNLYYNQNIFK